MGRILSRTRCAWAPWLTRRHASRYAARPALRRNKASEVTIDSCLTHELILLLLVERARFHRRTPVSRPWARHEIVDCHLSRQCDLDLALFVVARDEASELKGRE